jgi:hypothetical protein
MLRFTGVFTLVSFAAYTSGVIAFARCSVPFTSVKTRVKDFMLRCREPENLEVLMR